MAAGQGTPPTRRIRLSISGRVQGVGFRGATAAEATRLGLTGWVANQPDGGVIVEAEGPAAAVDALAGWCRRGPSLAVVTAVDARDLPADGAPGPFTIRPGRGSA